MTAAATTEGLSVYPHKVLTTIAREAGRPREPYVAIVRMLAERMEASIVDELRVSSPRSAARVALQLHRRHWRTWTSAMQLASALAAEMGVTQRRVAEIMEEAIGRLANDTKRALPKLPKDARLHLRASAILLIDSGVLSRYEDVTNEQAKAIADSLAERPDSEVRFPALLHALLVIGERGGVPDAVADSLGLELWRTARSGMEDEEAVEDAYWAAVAAEAAEGDDKVVPFRPRVGRKLGARAKRARKKSAG